MLNRIWSILFFLVPVCGIAAFVCAAVGVGPLKGAWLPENYSESGVAIDRLWYLVHWICALFFALTGLLIAGVLWTRTNTKIESAKYIQDNKALELTWTIIPAAILVGLGWYQLHAWNAQRVYRPKTDDNASEKPATVRVVAKQFGWEFHYPGADLKFDTLDDFFVENLMVVPDDEVTVMELTSRDVIHSFFVPKLRLKHDVVPGMAQTAWFKPLSAAKMNIVCAELCGWGHYKMNAKLEIVTRVRFNSWILEQQSRFAPPELQPYGHPLP